MLLRLGEKCNEMVGEDLRKNHLSGFQPLEPTTYLGLEAHTTLSWHEYFPSFIRSVTAIKNILESQLFF